MKFLMVIAFLLHLLGSNTRAQTLNAPALTESFDTSDQLKHWVFSNGSEFPGSEGSLASGHGVHGAGAVLSFRFSCVEPRKCGHYVAATQKFVPPLDLPAQPVLRFWANVPPQARLAVRITDETGQTLQYLADPSGFEQNAVDGWQQVTVSFNAEADSHWGGGDDGIFHGKLGGLAIVAEAHAPPCQSHLDFDELSVGSLPPVKINMSSALLAAPLGTGVLGPLLGVNIHEAPARALDMARDAGFSFVRADLTWQRIEREDRFDFSPYDPLLAELRQRGMGVLWVLGYGHPNHGGKFPKSVADRQAFGKFAAAAAEHFRGPSDRFEIWNEPDNTLGDPVAFGMIVQAGAAAIRKANPNAEVSSGGISQWDENFFKGSLLNCNPKPLSAIGFHGYRDRPETIRRDLTSLQALIDETCKESLPVWDTEWGYSSYPKKTKPGGGDGHSPALMFRQAVLGTRELLSAWASGFPLIVWYDLLDDNDNKLDMEGNFGLLNRDFSPKPVFVSTKVLTQAAKYRQYVGLVSGLPSGVHAMRLEGNLDTLLVVWNDDARVKETIELPVQSLQSVTDLFGKPMQLSQTLGNPRLVLAEESGPIYAQFKK